MIRIEDLENATMVNEWINAGINPVTGIKEDRYTFHSNGRQTKKQHQYDYIIDADI